MIWRDFFASFDKNRYICSMISVVEHIEYLVSRHDCVVVPGFGAFIAQYEPAHCDADGSAWYAPERRLSFNEELTHNDGLLVNSVMRREGCAYDVANDIIRENVASFNKQLDEEGELSFGMVGIFKLLGRNLVFVPRRTSAYEFYGMAPFTMRPLNALQAEPRRSRAAASWFAANRTYLKIAASILVLLVLSFVLSTPISVKDGNQEYASMNAFKVSTDGAFPYVAEVHELAIAMPRPDADSVVVKGYGSQRRGEAAAERTIDDKYFLIVCSVLSQSEADKFIAAQTTTGYDFRVLARNVKYRVYVASGKSVPVLMELKYAIADDYPDAWVHYSK